MQGKFPVIHKLFSMRINPARIVVCQLLVNSKFVKNGMWFFWSGNVWSFVSHLIPPFALVDFFLILVFWLLLWPTNPLVSSYWRPFPLCTIASFLDSRYRKAGDKESRCIRLI